MAGNSLNPSRTLHQGRFLFYSWDLLTPCTVCRGGRLHCWLTTLRHRCVYWFVWMWANVSIVDEGQCVLSNVNFQDSGGGGRKKTTREKPFPTVIEEKEPLWFWVPQNSLTNIMEMIQGCVGPNCLTDYYETGHLFLFQCCLKWVTLKPSVTESRNKDHNFSVPSCWLDRPLERRSPACACVASCVFEMIWAWFWPPLLQ